MIYIDDTIGLGAHTGVPMSQAFPRGSRAFKGGQQCSLGFTRSPREAFAYSVLAMCLRW